MSKPENWTEIAEGVTVRGQSYAEAAERAGRHPSTIRRWVRDLPSAPSGPVTAAQWEAESRELLRRLGRADAAGVHEANRRGKAQRRLEALHAILFLLFVLIWLPFALVLGLLLIGFIFAPDVWFVWKVAAIIIAIALGPMMSSGLAGLAGFVFRLFAPNAYLFIQLREAHDALKTSGNDDVFRESSWRVRLFSERRKFLRSAARAERMLARGKLAGGWRGDGARQAEREHRRNAAASLSAAEMELRDKGPAIYEQVLRRLRALMFMTALRDWSLADRPERPYVESSAATMKVRAWSFINGIAVLASLVAAIAGLGPALQWISGWLTL